MCVCVCVCVRELNLRNDSNLVRSINSCNTKPKNNWISWEKVDSDIKKRVKK